MYILACNAYSVSGEDGVGQRLPAGVLLVAVPRHVVLLPVL